MKSALLACCIALPLLFGVGWVADIITRDVVGLMVLSHGGNPSEIVKQPILGKMWPGLLLIWLVSSGAVLGLAKAGFGDHRIHFAPPPLPKSDKTETP